MAAMVFTKKTRRRRRRQKGLLTALGFVFAVSAVLRLGGLDLALADDAAAPQATAPDLSGAPDPSESAVYGVASLHEALAEIEDLRRSLDARAAALADREQAVSTAQTLVERRLAELAEAEARLEALISLSDTAAESDLDRLTSIYETMAPDQAARLFSQMSPSFAAGFLSRMAPASSAALLAEMTPEAAYAVSVIIATRNATAPTSAEAAADTEN